MDKERNLELRKIVSYLETEDCGVEFLFYKCQIIDKTKNKNIVTWDLNDKVWEAKEYDKLDPDILELMDQGNEWLNNEHEKKIALQNKILKEFKDLNNEMCSSATHFLKGTWDKEKQRVIKNISSSKDVSKENIQKIIDGLKISFWNFEDDDFMVDIG